MKESEQWLSREDAVCRSDRITRLDWVASLMPPAEYLTFSGGEMSKYLFEEVRYCFVYGQFLASIVLGFAFIERTLAAWFHMAGRDDLERANISRLLSEARDVMWLTQEEYNKIERIRSSRNPVTHFRAPLSEDTIEYRALNANNHPYSIIEQKARDVLESVIHMLMRNAL